MAREFIEVSHVIEDGMVTYKGLPEPRVTEYVSRKTLAVLYAEGVEFQIDRIDMIGNTGTFLSAPFHRFPHAEDVSDLPLNKIADLDCIVIDSPAREGRHKIALEEVEGVDVKGKAVLIHTGWAKHWGTEKYLDKPPYLGPNAAKYLAKEGAELVGIDSPNIDDATTNERPVYTTLLSEGTLVIEHMTNLGKVPKSGGRFFAVPPAVRKMGSFPVRAFVVTQ